MRMLASCMQCQIELGHPSFEPIMVDYYDDGLALVECSAGHKTALLVQSPKFEMLLGIRRNRLTRRIHTRSVRRVLLGSGKVLRICPSRHLPFAWHVR